VLRLAVRVGAALAIVACSSFIAPANGAIIVNADANGYWVNRFPQDATKRYHVLLDPVPPPHIGPGATAAEMALLAGGFPLPGFSFLNDGPANGEFRVVHYDADVDRSLPFEFTVQYVAGPAGPPPGVLRWIQFIDTNAPILPGLPRPYLDPQPNDDTLPFYWTNAELPAETALAIGPNFVNLQFKDRPSRPLNLAPVNWRADLYLASVINVPNPGGGITANVAIHDGLRWGFEIQCPGPGAGPNVSGGVAGDKFEMGGFKDGSPPPVCRLSVPEPPVLLLTGLGLFVLGMVRTKRKGTPPVN